MPDPINQFSQEYIIQKILDDLGLNTYFWNGAGKTVLGFCNSVYQHIHQQSKCYPTLADGVVITGGAGAWQLGNKTQIIPGSLRARKRLER